METSDGEKENKAVETGGKGVAGESIDRVALLRRRGESARQTAERPECRSDKRDDGHKTACRLSYVVLQYANRNIHCCEQVNREHGCV